MTTQPQRAGKTAGAQEKVWTEPLLQRIDPTPELVELFTRIRAAEGASQIEPLKRRLAAMRRQGADLS